MKTLVVLHNDFEEIEAITPIDLLRRASLSVWVASRENEIFVRGRSGITVKADMLLETVIQKKEVFDCILLPGGPGVKALCQDKCLLTLLQNQVHHKRWVAAICAAPLVLEAAHVLKDYPYTAHPSTHQLLPCAIRDKAVVVSKPFITSQSAGTAIEFSLKIIEIFCGIDKRNAVAQSICYSA